MSDVSIPRVSPTENSCMPVSSVPSPVVPSIALVNSSLALKVNLKISYVHPKSLKRITNEEQFKQYYRDEKLPVVPTFDFSRVLYCICHRPLNKSAAKYIKCSLGKYGCNGWMHPACVGLGDKSQSELNSMKYITCPFCTVYLEGSGDISSIKIKYPEVILLRKYTTPICVDTVTNVLSKDNQFLSITASHNRPATARLQPILQNPKPQPSQQSSGDIQSTHKSGASAQVKRPLPPPPNMPTGIFQHRLLMDLKLQSTKPAATTTVNQKSKDDTTSNQSNKRKRSVKADEPGPRESSPSSSHPRHRPQEGEEVATLDDDFAVTYSEDDPLIDRVRKCRREDGKIENVRLLCGWIKKSTVSSHEGKRDAADDEPPSLEEQRLVKEKILSKLQSSNSTRLLMRARQRPLERQRNMCIERSIAQAFTGSTTRRKPTANFQATAGCSIFPSDGRRSTLCYLPAEDGGLRLASVSHVVLLKSIHQWCCSRVCGYCLASLDPALPAVSEKFGVVSYAIHLQCQLSLQRYTSDNRRHDSIYFKSPIQFRYMDCLGTYEYERSEDAECDLCGLKGGVMQYFAIHSNCSMLTAPSTEGWLAHISCCFYLSKSNYLTPLTENVLQSSTQELSSDTAILRYYRSAMKGITGSNPQLEGVDSTRQDIVEVPSIIEQSIEFKDNYSNHPVPESSIEFLSGSSKAPSLLSSEEGMTALSAVSANTVEVEIERVLNDILSHLCSEEAANSDITDNYCAEGAPASSNSYARAIASEEEEEEESPSPPQDLTEKAIQLPLSRFDLNFGKWRCSLCGLHSGLTFRCAAATCTVRCHPICAYLSSKAYSEDESNDIVHKADERSGKLSTKKTTIRKWLLCSSCKWNGYRSTVEYLTIFCPVHSFGQDNP
eukprot:gene34584-44712_t